MRHPEFNPNLSDPQFVCFSIYTNDSVCFYKSQKSLMLSFNAVQLESFIYYESQLRNIIKNQLFHSVIDLFNRHTFVLLCYVRCTMLRV